MIPLQILSDTFKDKEVIFKLYGIFYKRIPDEIQAVINVANTQMVAVPGTQLYSEHHPKIGNVFSDEAIFNYYEPIKDEIENMYKQKDSSKPFTTSTLLTYFLEKNDGNLKSSLGDMAGFLKYMIRSYWGDGTFETKTQIDWVRSHVIDQINKNFSLNKIPSPDSLSDESRDNVISVWGLIYHVPYLVSMLAYVSPNIIRIATMYEYATHKHVAGAYKIKVDTDVIKKMDDMFRYFQKFN
ncbi:hypothetical protein A2422_02855 [Candidatus Woesebacteria bacterium RIFOXYC1_FULL_31_51]|uniref:Uncharacterized protein n=1 Tax=Candidatus Woesebacteria bacterium GW2011_GWC2_31_9 TaxID=1618586 RepID=A0A0F9YWU2_9BACT|nr:MAG: hypothetical protein UR17_C0001G0076 [Candidatus Woesebacteria bacterium GW2011_GWF1_31_35]KKP23427.1 MAG: hypothetical protein UR11_C0001G0401 [Candidatus Woesebacteria bacterium GW2011_GWC1_30_29]KKP26404.1 MAG: hypothetical protein UR13_C0004G0018 [Candidatus Woesebacteria bacterium GW2011_GWD1_31_12]KKP27703.1 MAG: hypothetical protein UR16_C0002G0033 [Candidatus Woesebacteria bacterium GW2011_GWB1_31_29]KKP30921.1 MAG: hypothetical protein UR21_C0020G0016 [Candidatus Woesebacteria 